MKTCNKCTTTKPLGEFRPAKNMRDGLRGACRECENARAGEYRRDNPKKLRSIYRSSHLKRLYGISPEDYDEMLADQDGVCWICRGSPGERRLSVDHCHASGEVRGLLCNACNLGLGKFQDNPALLGRAIKYLKENG